MSELTPAPPRRHAAKTESEQRKLAHSALKNTLHTSDLTKRERDVCFRAPSESK